jgi:hypothetical protein
MPAEDRDRLFERALARHLRDDADGGDSACLDAETLAAYYEGVLSEQETSAAKNHLVSCPRCREIVAQLATTQSVSELRNQEDELVAGALLRPKNDQVYEQASAPRVSTRAPQETESRVAHFPTKKSGCCAGCSAAAIAAGFCLCRRSRFSFANEKDRASHTNRRESRRRSARRDSYVPPAGSQTPPQSTPKQKDDDLAAKVSRQQAAGKPAPGVLLDELESLPARPSRLRIRRRKRNLLRQ